MKNILNLRLRSKILYIYYWIRGISISAIFSIFMIIDMIHYFRYSLYYSQPFVEFAKIRLVREEWMHLKGWWLTLNRTIDDEPIYMFLKLYYDNAFKFVFDSHCYGLEKSFYKYFKGIGQ